jgi:hypothetical protein
MLSPDFYGKKGFIWWTGIVEDTNDPLKIGSLRVRIIGVHSEDKSLVPTESLPWAQVALPINGSRTTNGPREGDWVFGFFQDGDAAQIPVVMGLFPGIESVQSQLVYVQGVQRKGATNVPAPPINQPVRELNQPTTQRLSRGIIEKTGIEFTNNRLAHSCGLSDSVAATWAVSRAKMMAEIMGIRVALEALFIGESVYPWLQNIMEVVKTLRKYLKLIQKVLNFVKDVVLAIAKFIQYVRDLIAWILSLPEKIARFIRECVRALFAEVASLASTAFGGIDTGLGGLVSEVNGLYNDTLGVARTGATVVALTDATLKSAGTLLGGNASNFDARGVDNFATLADNITLSASQLANVAGNDSNLNKRNSP